MSSLKYFNDKPIDQKKRIKKFENVFINYNFKVFDNTFSNYSELVKSEIIQKFIFNEVERSTKELAPFEKLKAVIITENEFSLDLGEITPTLKVRRKVIEQKFIKEIESIYSVKR